MPSNIVRIPVHKKHYSIILLPSKVHQFSALPLFGITTICANIIHRQQSNRYGRPLERDRVLKRKIRSRSGLINWRKLWARDFSMKYRRDGIKIDKLLPFSIVTARADDFILHAT